MDKFRTMSAMLPAIVIVAIIAGVLIGLLGRYWAIRRGDVDTPREAGKVAWRWGLNGAYAFTVGGVVLMWATRKNFSRAEFKAAYRACRIDWQAVKPATWTLAHGAAMYALGGDCRVGKDESKRRCYRIKYLAEANRNRHAGIDTSGYDYL